MNYGLEDYGIKEAGKGASRLARVRSAYIASSYCGDAGGSMVPTVPIGLIIHRLGAQSMSTIAIYKRWATNVYSLLEGG